MVIAGLDVSDHEKLFLALPGVGLVALGKHRRGRRFDVEAGS
jgi:hypothetical protein